MTLRGGMLGINEGGSGPGYEDTSYVYEILNKCIGTSDIAKWLKMLQNLHGEEN